jgi:hypothetical protein
MCVLNLQHELPVSVSYHMCLRNAAAIVHVVYVLRITCIVYVSRIGIPNRCYVQVYASPRSSSASPLPQPCEHATYGDQPVTRVSCRGPHSRHTMTGSNGGFYTYVEYVCVEYSCQKQAADPVICSSLGSYSCRLLMARVSTTDTYSTYM